MQRRNFIKGSGALLGLPFLESLVPKNANAQDVNPNSFAIFIRHPHGVVHSHWWPRKPQAGLQQNPQDEGQATTATGILKAENMWADLACSKMMPHLARTAFIRNLKMGFPNRNCHHNIHALQLFTGSDVRYSEKQGDALPTSESMEWAIAKQFHPTVDPLVMFAGNKRSFLNDTTSFREDGSKVIGENDPLKVYNRIFGMAPKDDSAELLRKSVNDYVREQIKTIQANPRLSASDKSRLDLHFSTIRDVEKKIAKTLPAVKVERLNALAKDSGALQAANADRLDEVIKLQMDIIALAISSGYVRGVNFQMLSGIDDTQFTFDGQRLPPAHSISHHEGVANNAGENIRLLRRLDMFWQEAIAYLATALSQDMIDNKPLLDYGVIMAASELAEGTSHSENNVPHMLIGSANGRLKTGEDFNFGRVSNAQVLSSVGWALGLKNKGSNEPMTNFGSDKNTAKGRINGLIKA
ncbi:MAG: DUF1552 domain-containing protein [Bdellovibrionota bacterium]|nr:MAG: DUF1552 domain-containing protein [Pseudomonadota bacterium]